ncbi:AAA family ATPase [Leptospira sp. GIMC2001]|uniref:AAA family ATPase n=1 Tax=Leptospira sp. GIMC2001 TaxID=1513297 RepID=UPI00234B7380|nr:AAA family ATPase [Leptospira sp. GIMC2001]WCL50736.1 AAA family ATPase [Leptospira sp. GIMC2001]
MIQKANNNQKKQDPWNSIYQSSSVKAGYFYLIKILEKDRDMNFCDEEFLRMFSEQDLQILYKELIRPFFQNLQEQTDSIENERMSRNYRGRTMNLPGNVWLNYRSRMRELSNLLETITEEDPSYREILCDFFMKRIRAYSKNFTLESDPIFQKIINTLEALHLPLKYSTFVHFLATQYLFNPMLEWMSHEQDNYRTMFYYKNATGITRSELTEIFSSNSPFCQYEIFEPINGHRYSKSIELHDNFLNFINNDKEKYYCIEYIKLEETPSQRLESFALPELDKFNLNSLLLSDEPCKILLYGKPGAGKTEFARSLAQETKRSLYKIDTVNNDSIGIRKSSLVLANAIVSKNNAILLMDEADDLLNEEFYSSRGPRYNSMKKIWINEFLDSSSSKIIFITNEYDSIHESILRRFDYSLKFDSPDTKQLTHYWNTVITLEDVNSFFSTSDIETFQVKYPISVGGITTCIQSTKKILKTKKISKVRFLKTLHAVCSRHAKLIGLPIQKSLVSNSPYDPSLIHTDANMDDLEIMMKDYLYGIDNGGIKDSSLCILFQGKPGTGKTEYVKYLARKLGCELIQKRGSDLLNMYVGQTEKLIASAFNEAEEKNAIFFLDEADTFFRSRELATKSWEISQTNEFLTRMESFQGIFIAATNFSNNFDAASLRRFAWKCEFSPLKNPDKIRIFDNYFPDIFAKASFLEKESIKEIQDLTPGDFKAIWIRFRFRPIDKLNFKEIIEALKLEVRYKTQNQEKIVGF